MADRIIIVSGVMNSGTSAAASILHHLGVDFGNIHTLEELRAIEKCRVNAPEMRYQDFEDREAYKIFALATQNGALYVSQLAEAFISYFRYRMQNSDAIVGFKIPMFGVMGSIDSKALFKDLPIEILAVKRPIEEVFDSIERVMNPEQLKELHIDIAQQLGHLWYGWRLIHRKIKPSLTISYDTIKEETEKAVETIADVFQLKPQTCQIENAIKFIKGYRR